MLSHFQSINCPGRPGSLSVVGRGMQILPGARVATADTFMFCMCTPPLQTIGVSVLATLATVIKRGTEPDSLSDQRFVAKPRYCVSSCLHTHGWYKTDRVPWRRLLNQLSSSFGNLSKCFVKRAFD